MRGKYPLASSSSVKFKHWKPSSHTVPGLGLKVWGAEAPEVVSDCGWISEAAFHHPQRRSGNRTIVVQSQLSVVYPE